MQLIKNNQVLNAKLQVYKGTNIIRLKENVMLADVKVKQVMDKYTGRTGGSEQTTKVATHIQTNASVSEVLNCIRSLMKKYDRYEMEQYDTDEGTVSFRYWGNWEISDEDKFDKANDEECSVEELEESGYFEDYDQKTLCSDSSKILSDIVKEVKQKYSNFNISVCTSEKCWIDWSVSKK